MKLDKEIYIVSSIINEAANVITLCLSPERGKVMTFKAGQFIRVDLIDNINNLSSKSYSISSITNDSILSISVKKTGPFSSALHKLKKGDKISVMGPFGSFVVEDFMKKVVFLAGGIGMAPFFSIIKNLYERGDASKEIYLFYSNKRKEDIAFWGQLKEIEQHWKNLHIIHLLTQENGKVDGIEEYQRINSSVLKKYLPEFNSFKYFICGSVPFVTEISKIVENEGVDDGQIIAELFY